MIAKFKSIKSVFPDANNKQRAYDTFIKSQLNQDFPLFGINYVFEIFEDLDSINFIQEVKSV